ncbi:Ppx/GppA phosphatase family-domain-containing protein [Lasiosphaeria miniovina]|uniref:Ppx/GppA phosphatase family-domain-containing protein n=1 Tax=Lasiosphaeria miniovina TaxID=1954250 RepID=A0AA40BHB1_9PEZI|nr:Ppx/GppA phosphatase family-domain-containing protein [Lasiosphaeria miniovina]KAK0734003.1 Ppx/GppA phosphatase family-domain-containing protein [Lasiosphaeria miniovina]
MSSFIDIITLDNFQHKMPRWDLNSANHLFALVDMGSNGIRFSISDLSPPRARLLPCIYRERAAISLFDALNKPPTSPNQQGGTAPMVFPPETIKLVAQTLARFRAIAVDDYGVPPSQVTVFATEAMRRAQNAVAMLTAINAEVPDLVVYVLAPQVETLFGSVGARSGFVDVKGLFLDLGGGSVQMTYMDTYAAKARGGHEGDKEESTEGGYEIAAALAGESLPFGAARLIRVLQDAGADVQAAETQKLHSGMGEAFETLRAQFPTLAATVAEARERDGPGIDIYLCGGGFRGYGSMLMHNSSVQPYPIPAIGSYVVSGDEFGRANHLLKVNAEFDGKIFGMSKRRRTQFPAIVAVVKALIAAVPRIRSVTFCAGGNREGALATMLPREVRESNPLDLVDAPPYSTPMPPLATAALPADILDTLLSAFPPTTAGALNPLTSASAFSLHFGPIYIRQAWARAGEDADANASAALHDAVAGNPGCPGLTHVARAILGLTLCARWGAGVSPIDRDLYRGLRALVGAADPDALLWADYLGAATAALARVVPAWPKSRQAIDNSIRFRCTSESGKKLKILLDISISKTAARGLDPQDLVDLFKNVAKNRADIKVVVTVSQLG